MGVFLHSQGGWITGKKEKGTLIKYSGYMYAHTGRGDARKKSRSFLFYLFTKINYIYNHLTVHKVRGLTIDASLPSPPTADIAGNGESEAGERPVQCLAVDVLDAGKFLSTGRLQDRGKWQPQPLLPLPRPLPATHRNERKCTLVILARDLLLLDLDILDNDRPSVAVTSSLRIPSP